MWKKATASGADGACVEVDVAAGPDTVLVRDTKAAGGGPELSFTHKEWTAFLDGATKGEFDLA